MVNQADVSVEAQIGPAAVDVHALYRVLSDECRRVTLRVLCERDGHVGIRELAEAVLARTADGDAEALSTAERDRLKVSMYHLHAPKLEDAGLVAFDRDRSRATVTEAGERVCAQLA